MTVTVLGGALTLLTTCSSKDDTTNAEEAPRPTTTRATTTTLTPEEAKKQEVIAAREAADEAQAEALGPPNPNPDLPALAETHTGLMFDRMKETAAGLKRNGYAQRYPDNTQHTVEVEAVRFEDVDGQEVAFLEVCTIDDGERFVLASGKVLTSGIWTFRSAEAMRKVDGIWKLAERREDSVEEGVTGCAVD
jgi:hypothetical protein